ncbi:MAG: oligoribonuclease [Pseudomonadales bacterium]|jgi:oligoribonuclease|nr:oligoribonuclease [Pseudomonadales bacterium]
MRAVNDAAPLVWMDLEMTGLDPGENVIIEIATLVTDSELNLVAEGPVLAIHQPESELDKMDEWNRTHHGDSGLVERVRASRIDAAEAEQRTLDFLARWVPAGVSPLCGNSVHQDRRFLRRYMPRLDAHLHYRIVDVSTLKELARRWYPAAADAFVKREAHLALDDIRESIDELRHYRRTILRPPAEVAAAFAPPSPER